MVETGACRWPSWWCGARRWGSAAARAVLVALLFWTMVRAVRVWREAGRE
jgi:hypothetical protein